MKVKEIHEFLNRMWGDIFTLNEELKRELPERGFKVEDVEEVFGAYVFIDGSWEVMNYPHPAFEVKPQIEVGATPESYYFVVAIPKERLSEGFLGLFLELFPRSFIYGSENFLSDFYNWRRDGRVSPREVIERIEESDEKVLQFEANFGSVEALKKGLERLIDLGREWEIFDL
ncbi:DUF3201 domain-containing protein [Thermococcus sp.]|uniref:DUF3201 domain-containing protein n=1 Tax=Thermococcus sp. TaxID=35749 RepID=UPI0026139060|nr:DUF3201 domain-containing protein [Thermococcus sp.]